MRHPGIDMSFHRLMEDDALNADDGIVASKRRRLQSSQNKSVG